MSLANWQKLVLAKQGFFFDLDGTLLNSEPLHALAIYQILQQCGHPSKHTPADLENIYYGCSDKYIFEAENLKAYLSLEGFYQQKSVLMQQILQDLTEEQEMALIAPGILEFLAWAQKMGKRLAIVSASERNFIDLALKQFKMQEYFPYIVAHEDCATSKPLPGPYLTALEKTGLKAEEALAFEDSPPGLTSAKGAHIRTVEISLRPKQGFLGDYHLLLPT